MKRLSAIGLTTLLAACQGTQSDSWFPLVEGSSQVYEVKVNSEEAPPVDEWTLRVEGPRMLEDQPVMVRHHSAGVSYYLKVDDQGIRRVATRTDIDEAQARLDMALALELEARQQQGFAQRQLALLINAPVELAALRPLADDRLAAWSPPSAGVEDWLAQAETRSPELRWRSTPARLDRHVADQANAHGGELAVFVGSQLDKLNLSTTVNGCLGVF